MRKASSTNTYNLEELTAHCALMHGLSHIGNRWKPYILWKMRAKTFRFGELKRALPAITERMLILSLKELEESGLISRKDYGEVPPRVEYSLTDLGMRLQPVLDALYDWGEMVLSRQRRKKIKEAVVV